MKKFLNNVLIVDGSYMLMRAMRQPELAELRTKSGKPSGGVFGFLKMISSVIRKFPGYYPIVAFDHGRSPRRLELFPNYKHQADRTANPVIPGSPDDEFLSALRDQRQAIMQYLESIRIPVLRIPDWEGDDLVYLVSRSSKKCVVVSDDKDMIQMCSPTCKIYRAMADEIIEHETCDPYYKYPRYEYYKAIVGDGSDNIWKCCEGIGGTSANKIAEIMGRFVAETECNPHDYQIIFNYLSSPDLEPEWKSVRGLRKKITEFLAPKSLEQFTLNMKLADFNYIVEPDNMQTLIESQIIPTLQRKPSIMEAFKLLAKYEINTIDPGALMAQLVGANSVLSQEE